MCYAYSKHFSNGVNWPAYKKFVGARFARVYPLYFLTTMWAFVCCLLILHYAKRIDPFIAEVVNVKTLPGCLVLIQSLHIYPTPPLNTPSWSLSTEWWVYMLFPFMVPYFARLKTAGKLVTTLLIVAFYIFLRYVLGPYEHGSPGPTINMIADFALLRCLAGFMLGMLLFTFYEHRSGYAIIKSDWFFALSFLGVLAAMHFGLMDIGIVAFFPFVLLAAAYNGTRVKRILDTRPLQRLGDWSFSIYMVHMPIMFMCFVYGVKKNPLVFASITPKPGSNAVAPPPEYWHGLRDCASVLVLTLIIAALMYRFVEIPARNYLNNAFKTKAKPVDAEGVEV